MASYRGHLAFSCSLGAAYGALGIWQWHYDWGAAVLGAGLTGLSGLLPDLDSDSSVPSRELFGLAAALTPLLLVRRLTQLGLGTEQMLVVLAGIYFFIRYGVRAVFQALTVHRGMFHSIPALLISGLLVYLLYHSPDTNLRMFLAAGVMLGFFSHLLLDRLCDVDLVGARLRLHSQAGGPLKLFSPSLLATLTSYALLGSLGYLACLDGHTAESPWPLVRAEMHQFLSRVLH